MPEVVNAFAGKKTKSERLCRFFASLSMQSFRNVFRNLFRS
ncbi:hypothetical protein ECP02989421_5296 [Escherichia coli P0298942.1]|nr:hypothetical protein ECP02989421_5296 [Escherichia coli P0298942.1]ENB49954.1 hypothetical protein ECP029894212_5252 [Escherichia coli P0298942.12]END59112.1 hypothetical protein ECP02989423_5407 [Escherichia coli P0298942.3]